MKRLVLSLLLAVVWVAVTGSLSVLNILLGLGVGALSAALVRHELPSGRVRVRPLALLRLVGLFLWELALSAIRVGLVVLRPRMRLQPGFLTYPLTVTRDFEITLLANLITLTPGTLSVDVSDDRRSLTVHALECADPAAIRRSIQDGFERRIREAFPL